MREFLFDKKPLLSPEVSSVFLYAKDRGGDDEKRRRTCGAAYVAQKLRGLGSVHTAPGAEPPKIAMPEYELMPPPADPVLAGVRADRVAAGRLDSVLGQAAARLAENGAIPTPALPSPACRRGSGTRWRRRAQLPGCPDLVDELRRRHDLMRG